MTVDSLKDQNAQKLETHVVVVVFVCVFLIKRHTTMSQIFEKKSYSSGKQIYKDYIYITSFMDDTELGLPVFFVCLFFGLVFIFYLLMQEPVRLCLTHKSELIGSCAGV